MVSDGVVDPKKRDPTTGSRGEKEEDQAEREAAHRESHHSQNQTRKRTGPCNRAGWTLKRTSYPTPAERRRGREAKGGCQGGGRRGNAWSGRDARMCQRQPVSHHGRRRHQRQCENHHWRRMRQRQRGNHHWRRMRQRQRENHHWRRKHWGQCGSHRRAGAESRHGGRPRHDLRGALHRGAEEGQEA
jgi:hypothetical protein